MINELLAKATVSGIAQLYNETVEASTIQVQSTKKEFDGDITVVVFPLLRIFRKNPIETGNDLGQYLVDNLEPVEAFNVVKGFLNLEISKTYWLKELSANIGNQNFGYADTTTGKTYMVEYSSPNTNKPLHLGHLRNIFLGYSVAEILKANGHKVYKTQIINDRGIHICKSMLAWKKFGEGETPQSSGIKGDHFVGKYYVMFDKHYKEEMAPLIESGMSKEEAMQEAPLFKEAQEMLQKWESGDEEVVSLWKTMNQWVYDGFGETYDTMGVDFDKLYYESDTYLLGKSVVEEGLEKGVFYRRDDGSVWCDLTDEGLDEKLVLRKDGTAVYMTQDIGTAIERYNDFKIDGMIYTVGNEQEYHFKVLFLILKKLGYPFWDGLYHLSYGMVELPTGKMKTREGTVVDADEIMTQVVDDAREMTKERGHLDGLTEVEKEELYKTIGLGGLKYYLLRVDPKRSMMFNPEESIDLNGNTGPFVQYAHARIQSLLKKADSPDEIATDALIGDVEKDLIIELLKFPTEVAEAGKQQNPSILVNYTFDLVKQFNSFYQSVSILKEENAEVKNVRLHLSALTATVIHNSMKLLGIKVPEQM